MTIDDEVRTLTKVCRLLVLNERFNNTIPIGAYDQAISLLDTIDAADDEPERKPCAYHTHKVASNRAVILGRWNVAGCIDCGTIMRKELGVINGDADWEPWPEGGAK